MGSPTDFWLGGCDHCKLPEYLQTNTCFEDEGVVESGVRSIVATEHQHAVLANLAGRVIGSCERHIAGALLERPFGGVWCAWCVGDSNRVEFVLRQDLRLVGAIFG